LSRREPRAGGQWALPLALLALLIAALAPPLSALPKEEPWIELRSQNFRLISNAGPRKTEEIALSLERFRILLKRLRPASRLQAPVPTRVVVFKNERAFRPYKQWRRGGDKGLLGFFLSDQTGNFIAMNAFPEGGDALPVVYHEFTHFYVRHNFERLPLWVNEGLAEYYSSIDQPGDDLRVGVAIPRHIRWLRRNSFIPFERFLVIDEDSPEYNEEARNGGFYAQSWALVHLLLLGDDDLAAGAPEFLRLLGDGTAAAEASTRALGLSLDELAVRLRRYVNGSDFQALVMPASALAPPTAVESRPLSRAETLVHLGDLLAQTRAAPREAEQHYRAALEADPSLADAWAGLGNLARQEHRYGEAIERLERAMELGGASAHAHVWLADLLLGWSDPASRPAAGGDGDPPWLRARRLAQRALEMEPEFVEAEGIFGSSYFDDPAGIEPGIAPLRHAVEAFPQRPEMAYNLVVFHLRAGDVAGAREVQRAFLVGRGREELAAKAAEAIERTDLIERSNAALARQDFETAQALLRQVLALNTDPVTGMQLTAQLAQLETTIQLNDQIDRFNRAVELANGGRAGEARQILELLAGEVVDLALTRRIERLRSSLP
jgi:tetratricopeptide (TPR) repeat protein